MRAKIDNSVELGELSTFVLHHMSYGISPNSILTFPGAALLAVPEALAIGARCHPAQPQEVPIEIGQRGIARFTRNVLDRLVGG